MELWHSPLTNRLHAYRDLILTLEMSIAIDLSPWLGVLILPVLVLCVSSYYSYGIRNFEGPLLASFTDLWRAFHAYHNTLFPMRAMHEKYGDVVRIGPKSLSFSDPQAVKDIFGAGKNWEKVQTPPGCSMQNSMGPLTNTLI